MNLKLILILLTISTTQLRCDSDNSFDYSVYGGCGLFTHIGGVVGVGTEIIYNKILAANLAFGDYEHGMGYDIGVKIYADELLFIGLNYGIVDYSYDYEKLRTIDSASFTFGIKAPITEDIYMSGYLGITASKRANSGGIIGGSIPRFGLLLGYNL